MAKGLETMKPELELFRENNKINKYTNGWAEGTIEVAGDTARDNAGRREEIIQMKQEE